MNCVWFRVLGYAAQRYLICELAPTSLAARYGIYIGSDGGLKVQARGIDGGAYVDFTSVGLPWATDQWYLVTTTYNSDSNEQRIYRDGVLVAMDTNAIDQFSNTNPGAFCFGTYLNGASSTSLNGIISESCQHLRVLSPSEISGYYQWATRRDAYPLIGDSAILAKVPRAMRIMASKTTGRSTASIKEFFGG